MTTLAKETIYRKVFIRSEDDLPKERGFYFIHYKYPYERLHTQMSCVYFDESIKGLWHGKDWYDWYLLPVELPTEEEIDDKFNNSPLNSIHPDRFKSEGAKWLLNKILGK